MTISNYFFDEDEVKDSLAEFGKPISWIDADGALRGEDDDKVYGLLDRAGQSIRDDTGGLFVSKFDMLTVWVEDGKEMLTTTEIRIDNETWRPRKNAHEIIDDGSLMVLPLEKL